MNQNRHRDLLDEAEAQTAWIVTYSDLVTLLLVFFVFLYSMSSLSLEKFKIAIASIRVSLSESSPSVGLTQLLQTPKAVDNAISIEDIAGLRSTDERIISDVKKFITDRKIGDYIVLQMMDNKITIRVQGKILFRSGTADLSDRARPVLNDIARIIRSYPQYHVNIKGHTDNVPISTSQFPSNWELSAVRATGVLKFMIQKGISPYRLTATGYADMLPIIPNDTPVHRAINRRVEFVLEKEKK
ncbi:MAG: hypothetical protein CSA22_02835 [Deltaproteobacteria bacterium]|nr:MAG: hypothetical protein CSA22_02835 [Deltaproteobacteria bacterium]